MATATLDISKRKPLQRVALQSTRQRTAANPASKQQQRVVLNVAARKYNFLMELLGSFSFVQVEENSGDSREEIIANLKEAAKDLRLIKAGKLKTRSLSEFLDEL
ncbi:MAG: hypothetical protein LBU92_05010 [Prevotellaceae bacterium]|jgi:hypothetical protein|nr:hypothetical protein [Prevotellaceae bacterium]